MKKILLLFILILLSNCQDKKFESKIEAKEIKESFVNEDFNVFFEKFKNDSVFQKKRVIYPLKVKVFNIDNLKTEAQSLDKDNYSFFNIDDNEVAIKEEISKDSAKIILQGRDNGILIHLKFSKINGIWKLILIDNQST